MIDGRTLPNESSGSRPLTCWVVLCLLALLSPPDRTSAEEALSPQASILGGEALTLIRDNCISCHGGRKTKSGLKLTTREDLLKGGDEGRVVAPGKADESRLLANLHPDAEVHMPPKGQFTPEQILTIRDWINLGVPWVESALKIESAFLASPSLSALPESYRPALALALSPDETKLAASHGNALLIYDLTTTPPLLTHTLVSHADAIQSIAWSKNGKILASGGFARIVIRHIPATNVIAEITENIEGRVTALTFSDDGHQLFSSSGFVTQPARIKVWDTSNYTLAAGWDAHEDVITALLFDAVKGQLFSTSIDRMVKCWNVKSFEFISKFEGHTDYVLALAINAKGELLATGGSDNQLKIWDIATGEQKMTIGGHPAAITGLYWTGQSNQIASACEDGILRLSTESKNRPQKTFRKAPDVVYAVTATTDGKTFFGGCHDGIVYSWDADGNRVALAGPEQ